MPEIYMDVDTALSEVPVNVMPLIDDGDFKTVEDSVAYNASGMDLRWNFVTPAGSFTSTAVTPTSGGTYDWNHQGDGIYTIEIPASGGASINNDTEGYGWFSGKITGVLPFRGPIIGFRASGLNDLLCESAYSATRGLAGTALPNAAADAAGGLPISDAGGLDLDAQIVTKINDILTDTGTTLQGELDGIQADTEDIQTRLPAALVGGRIDATIDGTGMETGAVDAILNRDASGSTTNSTLGAIINDWENGGRLDLIVDDILTDTGTTLQGELDGIQADTEDIQTRLPAALVGGRIDATIDGTGMESGAINALIEACFTYDATATYATAHAGSLVKQTADNAGGSALTIPDIIEAMFTTNAVTDYSTAGAGSVVKQIADNAGGSALTEAGIADAVLDELLSGHTTSGSLGERIGRIPNVAAGASGGLFIAGSNAATTVASMTCTGAFTVGDGIAVTCSTSNRSAFSLTGNGTGHGWISTGGATGDGMRLSGGGTSGLGLRSLFGTLLNNERANGAGLRVSGPSDGKGIGCVIQNDSGMTDTNLLGQQIEGVGLLVRAAQSSTGINGNAVWFDAERGLHGCGLYIIGNDNEAGLHIQGGPDGPGTNIWPGTDSANTANGLEIRSGPAGGAALRLRGGGVAGTAGAGAEITSAGNIAGVIISGSGSGEGMVITGGETGPAVYLWSDTANTVVIEAVTSGSGVVITGLGSGKHAVHMTGGSGTGRGLQANSVTVSGTTTLTGAVSLGSTFTVTGTTTLAAVSASTVTMAGLVITNAASIGSTFTITGGIVANVTGNLSGSVGSLTGHTNQTGDGYAILNSGTHGNAALKTLIDTIDTVVDAILADTAVLEAAQAEPSAVPAANASPLAKLAWLALLARNKITETSTTQTIYADNGSTVVATSTVSDDNTTFTRGKLA